MNNFWENQKNFKIKNVLEATSNHKNSICISLCAIIILTFAFNFIFNYSFAVMAYDGDKVLATALTEKELESAITSIQQEVEQATGEPYVLKEKPQYKTAIVKNTQIMAHDEIKNQIIDNSGDLKKLTLLTVDGQAVGATQEQNKLIGVLDDIKGQYTDEEKTISAEFDKEVGIKTQACPADMEKSAEEIKEILAAPTPQAPVIPDDKVQVAALYSNSGVQTIIAPRYMSGTNGSENAPQEKAAPQATVATAPLLGVKVVELLQEEVEVPYDIEKIQDSTMYIGEEKVIQEGVVGTLKLGYKVTKLNNVEQERSLVSQMSITKPVSKIVKVGTKVDPRKPTGTFIYPADGRITSPFGYRGRGMHTGLDIAAYHGAPIKASDGGVVTFTGWKSGYGYSIIIDHGNGVETLYAHNSSMLVSVGDKVKQGELIAKMGSTGNSTGNHCHFEIIINGSQKNPINYLR